MMNMKQGRFYLNHRCLWREVKVMTHFHQRLIGMLYLKTSSPQRAFWFPRCQAIHTWGMRFALDIVALDKQYRIVAIKRNVQPRQMLWIAEAHSIIECEAGCPLPLESWQGQQLRFEQREDAYA
jgi:uncharacterized protein